MSLALEPKRSPLHKVRTILNFSGFSLTQSIWRRWGVMLLWKGSCLQASNCFLKLPMWSWWWWSWRKQTHRATSYKFNHFWAPSVTGCQRLSRSTAGGAKHSELSHRSPLKVSWRYPLEDLSTLVWSSCRVTNGADYGSCEGGKRHLPGIAALPITLRHINCNLSSHPVPHPPSHLSCYSLKWWHRSCSLLDFPLAV